MATVDALKKITANKIVSTLSQDCIDDFTKAIIHCEFTIVKETDDDPESTPVFIITININVGSYKFSVSSSYLHLISISEIVKIQQAVIHGTEVKVSLSMWKDEDLIIKVDPSSITIITYCISAENIFVIPIADNREKILKFLEDWIGLME